MIYRSNLTAPNLHGAFPHLHMRPMLHSMGHSVPSDWSDKPEGDQQFGLYKNCGCMTVDECSIVFNVAKRVGGRWLDIGSHTCFTTSFLAAAGCDVEAVDPMYRVPEFMNRAGSNLDLCGFIANLHGRTSDEYFAGGYASYGEKFSGVCIDGDHMAPHPMRDAQNAHAHLTDNGVILMHDAMGQPVWSALVWLMDQGYKVRVYHTPHMVGLAWRSGFEPPEHVPDPRVDWSSVRSLMAGFPFERLS